MGQTNETEGKIALTKEQFIFYKALKIIEEAQCQDPVDTEIIKKAKDLLWRRIWKFAKKICFEMMGDFSTEEERNDVLQDMAVIFFERLPDYDPLRTTPTTYYVRYFKQVISDYIRKNKAHLTQYDANNARKIHQAINEYKKNGIPYTIDMISTKTGLSQKVIKNTIYYSTNAKMANVEEAYSLHANVPTPEEAYEEMENQSILYQTIKNKTTQQELELIVMRMNFMGRKELPYDKIAELTDMPIRQVKSIINNALCRLNQDETLRKQFGNHNQYKDINPICMQEEASASIEKDLIDFYKQIDGCIY